MNEKHAPLGEILAVQFPLVTSKIPPDSNGDSAQWFPPASARRHINRHPPLAIGTAQSESPTCYSEDSEHLNNRKNALSIHQPAKGKANEPSTIGAF